jgi:hypothetical protein
MILIHIKPIDLFLHKCALQSLSKSAKRFKTRFIASHQACIFALRTKLYHSSPIL